MEENLFRKNCLRTHSGRYINLLDPKPELICASDIAIGLSRAPRFAGHTQNFYSVAQHSDWCRQTCEQLYPGETELAFKVFLHDAHEFILCDIPSPLKSLMPEYGAIADLLQEAIHAKFEIKVTPGEQLIIKAIDSHALVWEWDNKVIAGKGLRYNDAIVAAEFMKEFNRLCGVELECGDVLL